MEPFFTELLLNAGPLAALAGFVIWTLNRVWKDRLHEECRHAEELKGLHEQTLKALQGNTEALIRLSERLGGRQVTKRA